MKINVLIFPAGEINSAELHAALSHNVNIRLFGASSVERHGSYIFKNYRGDLPFLDEDNFLEELNRLAEEWQIDCIFPTHDTVALYFAQYRCQIKAKVIGADYNTAMICRDKKKTYELFRDAAFCPECYPGFGKYPCFIKPREGQGSVGAAVIAKEKDIPENIEIGKYVICEYLPGEEVTADCITDGSGTLRAVFPRKRLRTMAGVCVSGVTMQPSGEIMEIAEAINDKLRFSGLWFFQLKAGADGKYKLLEISARCAGTMCLTRARGINLPLLSVYASLGYGFSVFENPYKVRMDRMLTAKYKMDYEYDTVYIDYDDTVIEGDAVCLPVIRFLYQCRNLKKTVILITRHEECCPDSLEESMERHRICAGLFDRIEKLDSGKEKYSVICPAKAIFIDNAYAERKKVHDKWKIPVFDVEGMEVIADWKE